MRRIFTSLMCGLISFIAVFTGVFGTVDKMAEDILYHHPGELDGRIKIIKIDDKTMNQMGDFSSWNRDVYADLVEALHVSDEIHPEVIGFDILFTNPKDEASDARFAEVCAKYNNVVTGFSYVFAKELTSDEQGNLSLNQMAVLETVLPYDALRNATNQGFLNALMDEDDSIIRSSLLYYEQADGTITKSFSSAIYEKYMEQTGQSVDYKTDKSGMNFRYSGNPGDYENVSLVDVLDGTIPPEAFDGCIVLVGAYAAGMMDAYFVPVDRAKQMYGVEIHANMIQALLDGKVLVQIPVIVDAFIAGVLVALLAFVCAKKSVGKVVLLSVILMTAKLVAGFVLFNYGYMGNVLIVPILSLLVGVYYIAEHYYIARAEKKRIRQAFSKYIAPQVVEEIAQDGKYELRLGGENRNIAVLFVDIRGFTPLSESLAPEQVVEILNRYLELTTASIFRHDGTLDKFIGDATMAVYNAPYDTEDHVYKAILSAWDIVQGGNRIEKEFIERYGKQVGFGVGVHCGPAVVGNIGCDFRMDYTAIGDTVNTAARLESNAPKGTIYISQDVYEQLKDRITVEEVGNIPLKGKSNGVFVYSVTGVNGYKSKEEA